jgi:hypothetical protein
MVDIEINSIEKYLSNYLNVKYKSEFKDNRLREIGLVLTYNK